VLSSGKGIVIAFVSDWNSKSVLPFFSMSADCKKIPLVNFRF
jgi:hypothetical protein